jgi:hypothetical protein
MNDQLVNACRQALWLISLLYLIIMHINSASVNLSSSMVDMTDDAEDTSGDEMPELEAVEDQDSGYKLNDETS